MPWLTNRSTTVAGRRRSLHEFQLVRAGTAVAVSGSMQPSLTGRAFAVACALGLGLGCAIQADEDATADGWDDGGEDGKSDGGRGIRTVTFNDVALAAADGRSGWLTLNVPPGAESFTINVLGAGEQDAYLVDHLEDPNGERLVSDDPEGLTDNQRAKFTFGAGQMFSPNRAMPQAGFASLLVPNAPEISITPGTWKLRVRGVHFDAEGRIQASTDAPDVKVVIKTPSATDADRRLKLKIRFFLSGSHGLTASSAPRDVAFQTALREFTELYATAGIDVTVVSTENVDPALQEVNVPELRAPFIRPTGGLDSVNIVMVGDFWDPAFAGLSGGMPGPVFLSAAPYRAVFISTKPPTPLVPSTPMGLLMAHEVGHYLGLPHTVDHLEAVIEDPFDDTSDQPNSGNLMTEGGIDLSRTTSPIHLSPQQIDLLRRTPAVR